MEIIQLKYYLYNTNTNYTMQIENNTIPMKIYIKQMEKSEYWNVWHAIYTYQISRSH